MLPETKPVRPITVAAAAASMAVATTETWLVPVATVMVSPTAMLWPFTTMPASALLLESEATRTVTV